MSMLLGPLSDTMRSVSWRDCALAGDQTAGAAGSTPPAAIAVTRLRNSRRFISNLHGNEHLRLAANLVPKVHAASIGIKRLSNEGNRCRRSSTCYRAAHTLRMQFGRCLRDRQSSGAARKRIDNRGHALWNFLNFGRLHEN